MKCRKCGRHLTNYEARHHKCETHKSDIADDIVDIGLGIAISSMFDSSSSNDSSSSSDSSDFSGGGGSFDGGGSSGDW
jgi:uncharacterized membrane protein YgcG